MDYFHAVNLRAFKQRFQHIGFNLQVWKQLPNPRLVIEMSRYGVSCSSETIYSLRDVIRWAECHPAALTASKLWAHLVFRGPMPLLRVLWEQRGCHRIRHVARGPGKSSTTLPTHLTLFRPRNLLLFFVRLNRKEGRIVRSREPRNLWAAGLHWAWAADRS
jgi:hypothetical protein